MAILNQALRSQIIEEINDEGEISRRFRMKKRHDIFRDGGKEFLIEQIRREFGRDSLKEMRIAPINLLKKIINKRSQVYNKPPVRKATTAVDSDQALIDTYTVELNLNEAMQKANRYYNLFSNTALIFIPQGPVPKLKIVPPYLYSIVPSSIDATDIRVWIFNAFKEEQRISVDDIPTATGDQDFDRQRQFKSEGDVVASQEKDPNEQKRNFIFWTDKMHMTTNASGAPIIFDPALGNEQFLTPARAPVVNLAKDRDNETWATQGEDMIDLTLAIQAGWTDLLTISKHQGFSILTVISEEEPKQLNIGINKAVWLKQQPDRPTPSMSYLQASSPLAEYKDTLMDLLGLLLTTNDMNPSSVGGQMAERQFNSGFQALISMSDVLQAIDSDKPALRDAEKELWQVIKDWHNWMVDQKGMLRDDLQALGKFTDAFDVDIVYAPAKPLESDKERLDIAKSKLELGLATKKDVLKFLNPDMSDDEIEKKILEIIEEKNKNVERMRASMGSPTPPPAASSPSNPDDESKDDDDGEES